MFEKLPGPPQVSNKTACYFHAQSVCESISGGFKFTIAII